MKDDQLRFKYTDVFNARWREAGLSEADKTDFEASIVEYCLNMPVNNNGKRFPGVIISGTGGAYKYRYAAPNTNQGKSGSYRVIYFTVYNNTLWFVDIYDKHDTANLTDRQKNKLIRLSKLLKKGFSK